MLFQDHPELLAPFREGRKDVLERVYRAYVRSVDRYLRSLARARAPEMGQASVIADLVQDVFIKALSAGPRSAYDGLRDYGAYLSTVARNCFIDALRARGREVLMAPDDLPASIEAAPEPSGAWEPEVLAILNRYLGELPAALRGVYEQRFVRGLSQEDTSAALGLSRRGVRTAEARLRKGLRKALVRAGISPTELRVTLPQARLPLPAPRLGETRGS